MQTQRSRTSGQRDLYIVVEGWDRFQHYRDRAPRWIKCYTDLLDDDAYLDLTPMERATLHGIWLAFAKTDANLTDNTAKLSRRLNMNVTKRTLDALREAGFIQFSASKPLARCLPRVRDRERVETETEREQPAGKGKTRDYSLNGHGDKKASKEVLEADFSRTGF